MNKRIKRKRGLLPKRMSKEGYAWVKLCGSYNDQSPRITEWDTDKKSDWKIYLPFDIIDERAYTETMDNPLIK